MNTFDVLKRRGVKINFTAIIAAVVLIVVTVILFTCRSDDKSDQQSSKSSTTNSGAGKASSSSNSNKQKDDNTFDDHSGTSKLFKKFKFVGNSSTMVYHVTDGSCSSADKMNPDNIVELKSKDDARKKGYTRCDICKP